MAQPIVPHREIPLTRGLVALVDASDAPLVAPFKWCALRRKRSGITVWYAGRGRRVAEGPPGIVLLHRQIMGAPRGIDVDHEDGDGLNCRRDNMRLATRRQNLQNQRHHRAGKTSRFLGVCFCRSGPSERPWLARIHAGLVRDDGSARGLFLGRFATEEAAARAYNRAARIHFGVFAALNFIEQEDTAT